MMAAMENAVTTEAKVWPRVEVFRQVMEAVRLTQAEVAADLGISEPHFSRLLSGQQSASSAIVATCLKSKWFGHLKFDELFEVKDKP